MKKRSEALKQAQERYEEKRLTVGTKLSLDEVELLDQARGDMSRTGFVKAAVMAAIEFSTIKAKP